jgi:hypothetical protein
MICPINKQSKYFRVILWESDDFILRFHPLRLASGFKKWTCSTYNVLVDIEFGLLVTLADFKSNNFFE